MRKEKNDLPTTFNELPIADFLRSIDDFFHNSFRDFQFMGGFPVHQYETKSHYIIEAKLPGVKKEQIHLDIYSNQIKISVENSEVVEDKDDKHNLYQRSRSYHKAERIIMLPFFITERDIKASYRDGILKIIVPNKKKTIEIS